MRHNTHTHTKEGVAQFGMQVNREHGIWARECVSMETPETGQGDVLDIQKPETGQGDGSGQEH